MRKNRKIVNPLILLFALTATAISGCSDDKKTETPGKDINSFTLNENSLSLTVGEKFQLTATLSPADTQADITWVSSDTGVATVSGSGLVRASSLGTAVITASAGGFEADCAVTVDPVGPYDATAALAAVANPDIIYSKNVLLTSTSRIFQCFDFTSDGNIYYSQLNSATAVNICKAEGPGQDSRTVYMRLNNFGHGTQIVTEETDGKVYIWVNSNGTIDSNGESVNNRSFSRIEFSSGAVYDNYAGETFILNKGNQVDQQVAIDFTTRRILVAGRESGVRHHWIFDLDEVLALPVKEMSVSLKESATGNTITRVLDARDLNECRVLGHFTITQGSDKENDVWSYSHQGHELHGDYVYFLEGAVEELAADSYRSKGYLTVFDYEGNIVVPRTEMAAVSDREALGRQGLTVTGYAEPEGIKLKDGKLYLGAACRDYYSGSYRYATIFVYDCVRTY